MAILRAHVLPEYQGIADTISKKLSHINASETDFSDRVITHLEAAYKQAHVSKDGSTTGSIFEFICTEALSVLGVACERIHLHLKHKQSDSEFDIFVSGAQRPIFIHLKRSLRERHRHADRDSLYLKNNYLGCATAVFSKYDIPFDSTNPPITWLLTQREQDYTPKEKAIAHAKKKGSFCIGIDTDRLISVYDKERMAALIEDCKLA